MQQLFCFVLFFWTLHVDSEYINYSDDRPTFDELYQSARTAYDKDDHLEAVSQFEKAIADYRHELEVKGQCWMRCHDSIKPTQQVYSQLIDGQLNFLHFVIKTRSCYQLCKEKFLGRRSRIAKYMRDKFENKEPYSFLQYSLFKIGETNKALDAAYTHYEANPSNELMKENLEILLARQGRDWDSLKSLEELPHVALYKEGETAYNKGEFSKCVETFEGSLTLFYKELAKCNSLCEEQDTMKEVSYTASLFKHFQGILNCRKKCQVKMTTVNGKTSRTHFVPHYFHYLQYCYFQENNLVEAAVAAETYLLLIPSDPVMSKNAFWYRTQPEIEGRDVEPRPRAQKYMKQFAVELNLAQILDGYLDNKLEENIPEADERMLDNIYKMVAESLVSKADTGARGETQSPNRHTLDRAYRNGHRWQEHPSINHSVLFMEEKRLNGTNRVAFDNVTTTEECNQIMELVKKLTIDANQLLIEKRTDQVKDLTELLARSGDGYKHSHKDAEHPFTRKETFAGVTVKRAVEAAKNGEVTLNQTELYMRLSDRARILTQEYFDLPKRLNFAFTHLVCRHALADSVTGEAEEHLSHPIHSDNCNVNGDGPGTCPERAPAYTWRDYSALLYLNDDFTGGDFIFADHDGTIQARVKPKCGRFVAFRSNQLENLHGVLGVKSGVRCALPVWFTLSEEHGHIENDRADADTELMRMKIIAARKAKQEL